MCQSIIEYPLLQADLESQQLLFNPGYIITTDNHSTGFNLNYDSRIGIQKNIKNGSFQVETKLKKQKHHFVGMMFLRYQSSKIISRNRLYFNYKYQIKLTDKQYLTLGSSVGVYNVFIAQNPTGVSGSSTVPDLNLGLTYKRDRLLLGIASNQMLNTNIKPLRNAYLLKRFYSTFVTYKLPIGFTEDNLRLQAMYNYYESSKNDLASSISYYYQNKYGLGIVYRNLKGLSLLVNIKEIELKNKNQLNLSFTTSLLNFNKLGTEYQINLKYNLGHLLH